MSADFDMQEIVDIFVEESLDGLATMEAELLNLQPGAADSEVMNSLFRAAHSIKGGAATVGFSDISQFAHACETLMDEMRQGERDVTQSAVDLLLQCGDCLRDMINSVQDENLDLARSKELNAKLHAMLDSELTESELPGGNTPEQISPGIWTIRFRPHASMLQSCNDPQRLLRELNAMGEVETVCDGAHSLDFKGLDPEVCQLSWTCVFTAAVTREKIEEVFCWVDDECDIEIIAADSEPGTGSDIAIEESVSKPSPEVSRDSDVKKVDPTRIAGTKPAANRPKEKEGSSIRVNIDKVDDLINLAGELVITQSMLSRFDSDFDFSMLEQLREGLAQLARNTRDLQESVMAIRMLPIRVAFSRFPRLVRDTSSTLGKKVELRLTGESTELDKTVLEKIGDPLVHLVRNSLDHGLEMPDDRARSGKSENGVLELKAYHQGGSIVIEVIDDGAGINKEKVLAKARERGLVGEDEHLSDDKINNLIFMAGFSTVEQVSDLSGRGVGMDVVKKNIADLGGYVSVESETGKGSKFIITLPLTLAILDGQLVRVGAESYIISLVSIVETIRVSSRDVSRVAGKAELFKLRDQYLPVLRLHQLFDVAADKSEIHEGLLVVVESGGQRAGIFVDDLLDQQQVVIKSLKANYRQMRGVTGATILGDGRVALIIDVPGLMQLFTEQSHSSTRVA